MVELVKDKILKLTPAPGRRQQAFSIDNHVGLKVRASWGRGKLQHTYFVERRIDGSIQKENLKPVLNYVTIRQVRKDYEALIGAWAKGEKLSNTARTRKDKRELNQTAIFGDLIETYIAWQHATGKKGIKAIANVTKNHIRGDSRNTKLWTTRLNVVDSEQISDFLTTLSQTASPHIADTARQIIKAAYNKAANSFAEDIELKDRWKALGIRTAIPIQSKKIKGSDTVKSSALSNTQLHALMRCVQTIDKQTPAITSQNFREATYHRSWFILFHIYTGGQRATQLAELTASAIIDRDGEKFLRAFKHQKKTGASKIKHDHLIPLTPWIADCVEGMGTPTSGEDLRTLKKWEAQDSNNKHYLWNIIKGDNQRAPEATTLPKIYSKWIRPLIDAEEVLEPSDKIAPNWIRSTVETLMRQHFDTRPDHLGWLQDHGIGGVQNKHYNQYEYLDQKRDVLTQWYELCQGYKDE